MSYLVDALKKAERERHARRRQDMQSLAAAGGNTARTRDSRLFTWMLIALIAVNGALVCYLFYPASQNSGTSTSMGTSTATSGQKARPHVKPDSKSGREDKDQERDKANTKRGEKTSAAAESDEKQQRQPSYTTPPRLPPIEQDNVGASRPRARGTRHSDEDGHGSVTFSKQPLDSSPSLPASRHSSASRNRNAVPSYADVRGSVPKVTISGQLYSHVPGRSFILVNGRRYHEGQKLAAGPLVKRIGPKSATLRYHGRSYRVQGPG